MAIQFPRNHSILNTVPEQAPLPLGQQTSTSPDARHTVHSPPSEQACAPRHRESGSARPLMPISSFAFTKLPIELQLAIMREIHNDSDRPGAVHSLDALIVDRASGAMNKQLNEVLKLDTELARNHKRLKKIIPAIFYIPIKRLSTLPASLLALASANNKELIFSS